MMIAVRSETLITAVAGKRLEIWKRWAHRYLRHGSALQLVTLLTLTLAPLLVVAGHVLPLPLPVAALSTYVPHFALFRDPT
jgi:hypothetical protein